MDFKLELIDALEEFCPVGIYGQWNLWFEISSEQLRAFLFKNPRNHEVSGFFSKDPKLQKISGLIQIFLPNPTLTNYPDSINRNSQFNFEIRIFFY